MLEKVITEINNRLSALNVFSSMFGLCEIITKEKLSFPAEYCSNEYKPVSDFDKNNGTVYHRLIGSISISEGLEESSTDCDTYSERTYPMRLIICIKKDIYKKVNNDAYIEQKIAENIESVITFKNSKLLASELLADVVSVSVTNINTNRAQVFNDEYKGYEMFVDYEYVYLYINYMVTIAGNLSCYQKQEC